MSRSPVLAELWQGKAYPFPMYPDSYVENRVLLELLTPEMAKQYTAFSTPDNWENLVLAAPVA